VKSLSLECSMTSKVNCSWKALCHQKQGRFQLKIYIWTSRHMQTPESSVIPWSFAWWGILYTRRTRCSTSSLQMYRILRVFLTSLYSFCSATNFSAVSNGQWYLEWTCKPGPEAVTRLTAGQ
jgi:hypothetical protein